jgi:glycosyltransferase involved in cell wall biosynthesis
MVEMMKTARVTICVPTYNSQETLTTTLESIVRQTYTDMRILIVDNASSDLTVEIARDFATRDSRIEIVRNDINLGGEGNFNKCIDLATGDFICIFHADDVYEPDIVRREVQVFDADPSIGAVLTAARLIDETGKPGSLWHIPQRLFRDGDAKLNYEQALRLVLQYGNIFMTPSAMVRTPLWKSVGGFHGDVFKSSADLDVWMRIMKVGNKIQILQAPLINYRTSTHSFSFNLKRTRLGPHDILLVLDHYASTEAPRLTARDHRNHRFYHFKDAVNRAINYVILGERSTARRLIRQNFSFSVLVAATYSREQARLMAIGLATFILTFICRDEAFRLRLKRWRFRGT